MKTIFKIILTLSSLFSFSQEGVIVPLGESYLFFESGTYSKDINNELNPFVGTWGVTKNNIKYTFVFQKMEHLLKINSPTFYYYEDEMVGKYEVRDLNTNTVLFSTMNAVNYNDFEITSLGGVNNGELEFDFFDRQKCNRCTTIRLYKMTFQPGTTVPYQVRYYNFGSDFWLPDSDGCTYSNIEDIPLTLPFGSLKLTKQ